MRSRSCLFKNLPTTSAPKVKETPRSFSPHPVISLSGSDHNKSQSKPMRKEKGEKWFKLEESLKARITILLSRSESLLQKR